MAKKLASSSNHAGKKKATTESVRINRVMARRARLLAVNAGMRLPQWLEAKLGPIIEAEMPGLIEDIGMSNPD